MIKELPAIETKDEYEKLIVEKIDNKKEIAIKEDPTVDNNSVTGCQAYSRS